MKGLELAIKVLVVDDSAVVRRVFTEFLSAMPGFEVETAADPLIALPKMRRSPPDVVVLDLEMPRMDGLTFLEQIMRESPLPVVVCSGVAVRGREAAVRALQAGAVEIITKPSLGTADFLRASAGSLGEMFRGLVGARRPRPRAAAPAAPSLTNPCALIAIGASTGGPEALFSLIKALRKDSPPVVVVQHMPPQFTGAFASRLDAESEVSVQEARAGDLLEPGKVLIAPGGRHLGVRRTGQNFSAELHDAPSRNHHRPSVDVLFESVCRAAGDAAVGVILTGMGADGAEGLATLRKRGATTLAQDEATSVVFGMPKAAIARGAVDCVLPLDELGRVLARLSLSPASA